MKLFLVDNGKEYSYIDLFSKISNSTNFTPNLFYNSLYEFFSSMLVAVINNYDLLLLDKDTRNINASYSNCIQQNVIDIINQKKINSFEELWESIINSNSKITIYTSGTTGKPKEVAHSINNLCRTIKTSKKNKDNIWAFAYNPTHMAGLQVFFQALANKNTLVNIFERSREEINKLILKYSITNISATPTFYRLLLPYEISFPRVERVTFGGEKSDVTLYEKIRLIFPKARFTNIYATTEAASLLVSKGDSFRIPEEYADKIKIVDNELLVHRSLLGESEDFIYENDFYKTGDIIEWIDAGSKTFKFLARKNDFINVGGYKVNPEEVETVIQTFNGIRQAKVYGRPNSVLGNVLLADIELEDNMNISENDLRAYLQKKIEYYKIPRIIYFVKEIGITRTGKIERK